MSPEPSAATEPHDTREAELERALEQACHDLQQAHDELLKAQGCAEDKLVGYGWPMWSPQANTIRWAETLLGKDFLKGAIRGKP